MDFFLVPVCLAGMTVQEKQMKLSSHPCSVTTMLPSQRYHIRPKKVNYMFLRHRPRHFQPPPRQKILLRIHTEKSSIHH